MEKNKFFFEDRGRGIVSLKELCMGYDNTNKVIKICKNGIYLKSPYCRKHYNELKESLCEKRGCFEFKFELSNYCELHCKCNYDKNCDGLIYCKGYCNKHYFELQRKLKRKRNELEIEKKEFNLDGDEEDVGDFESFNSQQQRENLINKEIPFKKLKILNNKSINLIS